MAHRRDKNRYRRLEAWPRCHELALAISRSAASFPPRERFAITSQARRAAFSAAAHIAEVSARRTTRDCRRFLDNSLGSLAEGSYVLDISLELELLTAEEDAGLRRLHRRASQVTRELYASLAHRID